MTQEEIKTTFHRKLNLNKLINGKQYEYKN